ncbi:hypothetical protein [uncultured Thiothrix sp.]|uniref:hyaluronate lyase N-terminal domain-containing protein n=1 Tax=uncultured Thiothrix sp. TaxID=223185 RepID=UPI0026131C2A|nr:hypothetical protein [uncultured Thiothrix sp.]
MATIRLRRLTNAARLALTTAPVLGEPLWTTDTKQLFVGDGTTLGGVPVTVSSVPSALPATGALSPNKAYFLPAASTATMPSTELVDGDYIEFIYSGNMVSQPATVVFAHPVQTDTGTQLPAGTHQYQSNQHRKFIFKNGVWW